MKGALIFCIILLAAFVSGCTSNDQGDMNTSQSLLYSLKTGQLMQYASDDVIEISEVQETQDKIEVAINGKNVRNLMGVAVELGYPDGLEYLGYDLGDFLGNDVLELVMPAEKRVDFAVDRKNPADGISGSGTIIILKFRRTGSYNFTGFYMRNMQSAYGKSGDYVTYPQST
jgi:hypothetical protein